MSNITQKVLIDLETSKAQEEMKKLAKAGGNTADTIKALNDRAKELEKSLGAIKAAAPTSTLTAFKDGMKSVGNVMQPFNQGLELGKKLLGFADEGLQAYAKTSREAARDVHAMTGEFEYYKKTILEGVGAATVELGKSAVNFDQAVEALRRGGEKGFGKAYGDITKQWNALNDTVLDSGKAFGGLAKSLGETFGVITDKVATNATKAMEGAVVKARQLAEEARRLHEEFLAFQAKEQRNYGDARKPTERDAFQINTGLQDQNDQIGEVLRRRQTEMTAAYTSLGVDSLDAETQALQRFADVAGQAYGTIVSGSASVTATFKNLAKQQLLALGVKEAVEAASQIGYGFGALANPLFPGAAALHFTSAAKHGVAAALAGVGIGAIGAIGGGGSSSGSASAGRGSSGGGSGASFGNGSPQQGTGERIIVVLGDSFSQSSPRMQQLQAERTVDLAYGGNGVANR